MKSSGLSITSLTVRIQLVKNDSVPMDHCIRIPVNVLRAFAGIVR